MCHVCIVYACMRVPTKMTLDTTRRLLLWGWNLQHRVLTELESTISLRHAPVLVRHSRQVPSDDAETMKSLEADQSKSRNSRRGVINKHECVHVLRAYLLVN